MSDEDLKYYTYILRVKSTNQIFYVGKGTDNRVKEHRYRVNDKNKSHLKIYRKIHKLWRDGDDFDSEIVFRSNIEQEAYDKEKELISQIGIENLCNLTYGGDGSSFIKHTEETKLLIGNKNRGRKHSEETLALMREVHSGIKLSDEEKQNLKNKYVENANRIAALKRSQLESSKKVRRLDTNEEFDSISLAAKSINGDRKYLSQCIRENKPYQGIIWEFVENKPIISTTNIPKPIRRLDTMEEFPSIQAAADALGVTKKPIKRALTEGHKYKGIKFEYIDPTTYTPPKRSNSEESKQKNRETFQNSPDKEAKIERLKKQSMALAKPVRRQFTLQSN